MNAEFNWWLLIVGLVAGAALVWFVTADSRRRENDIDEAETPREALWLSTILREEGHDVSPEAAERLLALHRAYLDAPPPDPVPDQVADTRTGSGATTAPSAPTSETPNVPPAGRSATAGDGPTQ